VQLSPEQAAEIAWRLDPARFGAELSGANDIADVDDDDEWVSQRTATSLSLYPHSKLFGRKFADAVAGRSRFQIWEVGPRYGKTLVASNWGPLWYLEHWPNKRVILGSYGHHLAVRNGRIVRNLALAHRGKLSLELAKDSQAADQWNTTRGGGLLAAGVGGAMTGFGGDLIVIDDPFKDWSEAQSETMRENAWDWFRSVVFTRLHKGGAIIIVATRWHKDDLSGRLIAEDRRRVAQGKPPMWEVVRLPTIADGEARGEPDPLGREDGEVLCPDLFPEEEVLAQRETLGPSIHRAMHQQDPSSPEGSIFLREWWRWYQNLPDPFDIDQWTMSVDCAFKDRHDSSYVVVQVWARVGADHLLIDQARGRWDYVRTKSEIQRMHGKWPKVMTSLVEDKANGPAIISDLGRTISGFIPIEPKGSKESRAYACQGIVQSGHVLLPVPAIAPWVDDYVDELADFPDGLADDQVDGTTQYLLNSVGGPMVALSSRYGRSPARR